jgi:hypothetical protein
MPTFVRLRHNIHCVLLLVERLDRHPGDALLDAVHEQLARFAAEIYGEGVDRVEVLLGEVSYRHGGCSTE